MLAQLDGRNLGERVLGSLDARVEAVAMEREGGRERGRGREGYTDRQKRDREKESVREIGAVRGSVLDRQGGGSSLYQTARGDRQGRVCVVHLQIQ